MTQFPPQPSDKRTMEALYNLFQKFALEDQRAFYQRAARRYRKAADQVNRNRAIFALLTGLASALAGLIVSTSLNDVCAQDFQSASQAAAIIREVGADTLTGSDSLSVPSPASQSPDYCANTRLLVTLLVMMTIIAPALGAAFTTLADIYQWDRLISVYEGALDNLEVADAQSPLPDMDDLVYRASLRAYAEGTLGVMRDETAQWGQLIKTPAQLSKFIEEEREKAAKLNASADDQVSGREQPSDGSPG